MGLGDGVRRHIQCLPSTQPHNHTTTCVRGFRRNVRNHTHSHTQTHTQPHPNTATATATATATVTVTVTATKSHSHSHKATQPQPQPHSHQHQPATTATHLHREGVPHAPQHIAGQTKHHVPANHKAIQRPATHRPPRWLERDQDRRQEGAACSHRQEQANSCHHHSRTATSTAQLSCYHAA